MASEPQTFDVGTLQPFYAGADDTPLANVGLGLPSNRKVQARQRRRLHAILKKTRNATATIGKLPAIDESLHCVLNGSFALWDFIPAVLELSGQPIDRLLVATLGFSKRNCEALSQLVDAGQVKRVDLLCSHYFAAADAEIYAQMVELCVKHGFRIAALRTHAKVLLIASGENRIVIESSANLRSCFNVEQATLFNDPALFDFHATWIDELLREAKP